MNCLQCGYDNPATGLFCKSCGGKLDLSADEIESALVEKQKGEKKKATEFWMQQSLFLSIVLFVAAVTCFIFTGGAPEGTYYTPSATKGASFGKVKPKFDIAPRIEKPLLPLPGP